MTDPNTYILMVNTGVQTTAFVSSGTDPEELTKLAARMLKQGIAIQATVSLKTPALRNNQTAPDENALLFAGILIDAMKWREQDGP